MSNQPTLPALNGWEVLELLGEGGQARAYKVIRVGDAGRRACVAKVLKPFSPASKAPSAVEHRGRFIREVSALQALGRTGCPRIVEVIEVHLPVSDDEPAWYVMPHYSQGPMCRQLPNAEKKYAEVYRGNVDRVLSISRDLAETLAWMHGHEPVHVHRDVHSGNVFFASNEGPPVLGDFGLVHVKEASDPAFRTSATEEFGPWEWRPPELKAGSEDKSNPRSDVYLLGGLIYEALSGGRHIDETERTPGHFTHDSSSFSLSEHSDDPRIIQVNALLRNMLARDPAGRYDAKTVAAACDAILSRKAIQVAVPSETKLRQAAAAFRAKTPRVRDEAQRAHLLARCRGIAERVGLAEPVRAFEFYRQVEANHGDTPADDAVRQHTRSTAWAAVRALVRFEPEPPILLTAYVFVIRTAEGAELIASLDHQGKWSQHSNSYADDPAHDDVLLAETSRLVESLSEHAAKLLTEDHGGGDASPEDDKERDERAQRGLLRQLSSPVAVMREAAFNGIAWRVQNGLVVGEPLREALCRFAVQRSNDPQERTRAVGVLRSIGLGQRVRASLAEEWFLSTTGDDLSRAIASLFAHDPTTSDSLCDLLDAQPVPSQANFGAVTRVRHALSAIESVIRTSAGDMGVRFTPEAFGEDLAQRCVRTAQRFAACKPARDLIRSIEMLVDGQATTPPELVRLEDLSNAAIQANTLSLVKAIKALLAEARRQEDVALASRFKQGADSSDAYTRSSQTVMSQYKQNHKAFAKLLAEELQRRGAHGSGGVNSFMFEHETNPLGVEAVANELDYMARQLGIDLPDGDPGATSG